MGLKLIATWRYKKLAILIIKDMGDGQELVTMGDSKWFIRKGTDDLNIIKNLTEHHFFDLLDYKGGNFVDVGAHIGFFTVKAARKCNGKIIAIEPDPTNFKMLEKNTHIPSNYDSNLSIQLWDKAAFSFAGSLVLHTSEKASNGASINERPETQTKKVGIDCFTLDQMCKDLDKIEVLKIDSEGSEVHILMGAKETLVKTEKILIECEKENVSSVETILNANRFNIEDLGWHYEGNVKYLLARK